MGLPVFCPGPVKVTQYVIFIGVFGVVRLRVRRREGRLRAEGLRRHQLPRQVSHGEEAPPAALHARPLLAHQPQEGVVPVRMRPHHRLIIGSSKLTHYYWT